MTEELEGTEARVMRTRPPAASLRPRFAAAPRAHWLVAAVLLPFALQATGSGTNGTLNGTNNVNNTHHQHHQQQHFAVNGSRGIGETAARAFAAAAADCADEDSYLENTLVTAFGASADEASAARLATQGMADFSEYSCRACPAGASCRGGPTNVSAFFGYLQCPKPNINGTNGTNGTNGAMNLTAAAGLQLRLEQSRPRFERCAYPPACLGVRNREFLGTHHGANVTTVPGGCAHAGYVGSQCHRCNEGWSRGGGGSGGGAGLGVYSHRCRSCGSYHIPITSTDVGTNIVGSEHHVNVAAVFGVLIGMTGYFAFIRASVTGRHQWRGTLEGTGYDDDNVREEPLSPQADRADAHDSKISGGLLSILFSFLQQLSLVALFAIEWPTGFAGFVFQFGPATAANMGQNAVDFKCLMSPEEPDPERDPGNIWTDSDSFFTATLVWAILPLWLSVANIVAYNFLWW